MTGNLIQPNTCRNPVHQMTFLASITVPSSSSGRPPLTPDTRPSSRSTPQC
jgi:hypothetical protein